MTIRHADSKTDYEAARALILEYTTWLDVDFCMHRFDEEMADLPAMYGPPGGLMLLAFNGDKTVGCTAYRTLEPGVCEMKRLYVVPSARGGGLGRKLTVRLIEEARAAGFSRMVLDTLPKLATAIALYRRLGFTEVEPYYENSVSCVTFMSLDLSSLPTQA